MNRHDLEDLMDLTFDAVKNINNTKGKEYAGTDEALANFYTRAEQYGLDPKIVLGIFLSKHLDAINSFIRTGKVLSEPIDGRVHDAILYLVLLLGLVADHRADEQQVAALAEQNQLALSLPTLAERRESSTPIGDGLTAERPSPSPRPAA
jgi:hypothetical protein